MARQAVHELLALCFGQLQLHWVMALTDMRNLPCVALLESAGLQQEGHFRQNGWYKGEWCDEYQYAMLGADWTARH